MNQETKQNSLSRILSYAGKHRRLTLTPHLYCGTIAGDAKPRCEQRPHPHLLISRELQPPCDRLPPHQYRVCETISIIKVDLLHPPWINVILPTSGAAEHYPTNPTPPQLTAKPPPKDRFYQLPYLVLRT